MGKKLVACGECKHLRESPAKLIPTRDRLIKFRDEPDFCGRWKEQKTFDSFLGEWYKNTFQRPISEANPAGKCRHFKPKGEEGEDER